MYTCWCSCLYRWSELDELWLVIYWYAAVCKICIKSLFVYFAFFVVNCIIPNFVDVNQTNNVAMKNKLVLYLLVSLVASCIYPVTVWAKVNERFSLKNESVSEQIPLTKKVSRKTRSILIPPCSVALLESSLIFSFHSLSEDAEIILYNKCK